MASLTIILAFGLDLLIGDPRGYPHPVRVMGAAAKKLETQTRKLFSHETAAGVATTLIVVGGTYGISVSCLEMLEQLTQVLFVIVSTLLIYTTLSVRALFDESRKVIQRLQRDDVVNARKNLAMIVGRDTKKLNQQEILRATVETVSENTVDGIIAPLFYACIGGAPLALAYKAVNTLDSMFGYRNETYRRFGAFPARLDDAMNWLPARLGGPIIALSSALCGFKGVESLKTMIRDGQNHLSPNAGIPEAAMAGALGIQLGGISFYDTRAVTKPFIGEKRKEIEMDDVAKSHRIMFVASGIALIIFTSLNELFPR